MNIPARRNISRFGTLRTKSLIHTAHTGCRIILARTRNIHVFSAARNISGTDAGTSTVNAEEVAHFSRLSSFWWDEKGEFGQLHKMNPVRVQFIREKLVSCCFNLDAQALHYRFWSVLKQLCASS